MGAILTGMYNGIKSAWDNSTCFGLKEAKPLPDDADLAKAMEKTPNSAIVTLFLRILNQLKQIANSESVDDLSRIETLLLNELDEKKALTVQSFIDQAYKSHRSPTKEFQEELIAKYNQIIKELLLGFLEDTQFHGAMLKKLDIVIDVNSAELNLLKSAEARSKAQLKVEDSNKKIEKIKMDTNDRLDYLILTFASNDKINVLAKLLLDLVKIKADESQKIFELMFSKFQADEAHSISGLTILKARAEEAKKTIESSQKAIKGSESKKGEWKHDIDGFEESLKNTDEQLRNLRAQIQREVYEHAQANQRLNELKKIKFEKSKAELEKQLLTKGQEQKEKQKRKEELSTERSTLLQKKQSHSLGTIHIQTEKPDPKFDQSASSRIRQDRIPGSNQRISIAPTKPIDSNSSSTSNATNNVVKPQDAAQTSAPAQTPPPDQTSAPIPNPALPVPSSAQASVPATPPATPPAQASVPAPPPPPPPPPAPAPSTTWKPSRDGDGTADLKSNTIASINADIARNDQNLLAVQDEIDNLTREIKQCETQLAEVGPHEEEISLETKYIAACSTRIQDWRSEESRLESDINVTKRDKNQLLSEIEAIQNKNNYHNKLISEKTKELNELNRQIDQQQIFHNLQKFHRDRLCAILNNNSDFKVLQDIVTEKSNPSRFYSQFTNVIALSIYAQKSKRTDFHLNEILDPYYKNQITLLQNIATKFNEVTTALTKFNEATEALTKKNNPNSVSIINPPLNPQANSVGNNNEHPVNPNPLNESQAVTMPSTSPAASLTQSQLQGMSTGTNPETQGTSAGHNGTNTAQNTVPANQVPAAPKPPGDLKAELFDKFVDNAIETEYAKRDILSGDAKEIKSQATYELTRNIVDHVKERLNLTQLISQVAASFIKTLKKTELQKSDVELSFHNAIDKLLTTQINKTIRLVKPEEVVKIREKVFNKPWVKVALIVGAVAAIALLTLGVAWVVYLGVATVKSAGFAGLISADFFLQGSALVTHIALTAIVLKLLGQHMSSQRVA